MDALTACLTMGWMGKPVWMWGSFLLLVFVLMALDLGVFHRKDHAIKVRESLLTTLAYMALATAYGLWIGWEMGSGKAVEFYTGYVVEFSLAMDNVFVIATILTAFKVPAKYQHRVLFWGILGVLVLRGLMIIAGATLVEQFDWILLVFGGFLIFSGVKMLRGHAHDAPPKEHWLLTFLRGRHLTTPQFHGHHFFVKEAHPRHGHTRWVMTPLLVTLLIVEASDVVFALDSIPAIFAITTDPFIVLTSNVFAILGLRALYFTLAQMVERFAYLKYALAAVLVMIGSKIMVAEGLHMHVPPLVSLAATFGLLAAGVAFSLWKTRKA